MQRIEFTLQEGHGPDVDPDVARVAPRWKKYVNPSLGFEACVPEPFEIIEEGNTVSWGLVLRDPQGESRGAMSIHITCTHLPGVPAEELFAAMKLGLMQDQQSPRPAYTEFVEFTASRGFAQIENALFHSETPKTDLAELHRWFGYIAGNSSVYNVVIGGPAGLFLEWWPAMLAVLQKVALIPFARQ